uniref:Uncharacterized protein n=1 Tax=Anguilla anguilla TaxID=7936 RepID=A0A0E9Y2J3_ANGAN
MYMVEGILEGRSIVRHCIL